MRNKVAVWVAVAALWALAGCANQQRPAKVGDVGVDPVRQQAEYESERVRDEYQYQIPKTSAFIESDPKGALVEWLNPDGFWVVVGNTPTEGVVIEATGRPELFRVSASGFIPETRWIAATPGSDHVRVRMHLEPDLPPVWWVPGE